MQIHTARFGDQEIDESTVITFENGLLEHPELTKFKLFHKEDDSPVVHWLQSVEDGDVAYTVVDPSVFGFFYEIPMPDDDYTQLESSDASDIAVLLILEGAEQSEAPEEDAIHINSNVTKPIFLNLNSRKGLQRRIVDLDYNIHLSVPMEIPTPDEGEE